VPFRSGKIPSRCPTTSSIPTPEDQVIVLIEDEDLRKAEKLIESCEQCNLEGAEISFDNIFDQVTGSAPSLKDYLLSEPARCSLLPPGYPRKESG
jgi:hypothetical protein